MKDIHGTEIAIGMRVCRTDEAGIQRNLTVRWFNDNGNAFADDGDVDNNDIATNNWKLAAWLRKGDKVEVIK